MRHVLLALVLLAATTTAHAQDLLSGEYLPKGTAEGETAMRVARDGTG